MILSSLKIMIILSDLRFAQVCSLNERTLCNTYVYSKHRTLHFEFSGFGLGRSYCQITSFGSDQQTGFGCTLSVSLFFLHRLTDLWPHLDYSTRHIIIKHLLFFPFVTLYRSYPTEHFLLDILTFCRLLGCGIRMELLKLSIFRLSKCLIYHL